jgi:hypothetical protein
MSTIKMGDKDLIFANVLPNEDADVEIIVTEGLDAEAVYEADGIKMVVTGKHMDVITFINRLRETGCVDIPDYWMPPEGRTSTTP